MKRPRTNLCVPRTPGGYLSDPPSDCSMRSKFCPDPNRYEVVLITNYMLCNYCKTNKECQTKLEADRGRRRRIALQRNGE